MKENLEQILLNAKEEIRNCHNAFELEQLRIKYLGKKGIVTQGLQELGKLPPDMRPGRGKIVNRMKKEIEDVLQNRKLEIKTAEKTHQLDSEQLDVTLPGRRLPSGKKHPLTQTMEKIQEIFLRMGFEIAQGPEIELDYYNFEALNIPRDHPARDMQATFFITDEVVLRTHTSPVQIRVMEKKSPPIRIIVPGRVYRCDDDVRRSPMFHQVEGLMVDEGITFAHLKGVLTLFAQQMFGPQTKTRFRPSYFPFTEPSAEVDVSCIICQGRGCRICEHSGWLEILGAGMVHPAVYQFVNYDPEKYTGFAFGMGVERIAMLKYGIDDIRLFFENDLRFLEQF